MIETKIDYLQFSANIKVIGKLVDQNAFYKQSTIRFYKRMTTFANGVAVHYGNPNSENPLVVISGKACERVGVDADFCKTVIEDWGAKPSRIDLCVTTDKEVLKNAIRDKDKVVSKLWNTCKVITDGDLQPETIYFGDMARRGRKGVVRMYDKAKQLDLEDLRLHRIEVEMKHKHATTAVKRIANGEDIKHVMNAKFRIDSQWYKDIMSDNVALTRYENDGEDDKSEIESKMAWIEKQVVPSLQYVIDYDIQNGTNNFERILNSLNYRELFT